MAKGATGAQLERVCGKFRTLTRSRHDDERRFAARRRMPDGTVRIELRLLPDEAERVWKALHAIRKELRSTGNPLDSATPLDSAESSETTVLDSAESPEGEMPRVPPEEEVEPPSLADAAVAMAERTLSADVRSPSRAEPFQLFVHLREERLAGTELGWQAELHDGTRLEGDTLLRIACDCGLVVAETSAQGDVLDIGRRSRKPSPALRRALLLRDRGCRFPGCTATAFVEAHHITHWVHHGPTSLANTVLVCHRHHVAVHEGGFRIERDAAGALRFVDPRGRVIPHAPAPPDLACTPPVTNPAVAALHSKVALPKWNGGGLDLGAAIGALFFREPS
jgi:hypothetical protein